MDLSKISQLYIAATEAIKINSLILCNFTVLPPQLCPEQIEIYDLTIPSIIDFVEQGFGIGFGISRKAIIIHGTPTAPTRFDISLIEEGVPEDTADIPFHLSADFAQNAVIRDAWIKGKGWIRNQRAQGLPFTVGQSFKLEFRIAPRNGIDVLIIN
uniref:Galectin n=1 Tax=Meloidogyne enterolobii TaxID=390850 RepID=A0A6V7XWQ9_MELEN|nr:unnamed protein product [Meloidogyne enterolobii]